MYRGYDIAELAEHSSYEEVAYLLLEGELPSGDELEAFKEQLSDARALPPQSLLPLGGRARSSHVSRPSLLKRPRTSP